jgi:hypothetical protein
MTEVISTIAPRKRTIVVISITAAPQALFPVETARRPVTTVLSWIPGRLQHPPASWDVSRVEAGSIARQNSSSADIVRAAEH